jgi:chloramphenicol O-acetyltransferase type A
MRIIDLDSWPRRDHYKLFNGFDAPHFNMCANLDITVFYAALKKQGVSFTVGLVYLIARVANEIPEFRLRIHGEQVVEYDVVHPSCTILIDEERFSFCKFTYSPTLAEFAPHAVERIAYVKENLTLDEETEEDNLLFMSAIPWVSFTSFMHPVHLSPADSVPRFAYGKYFQQGDRRLIPLSVQGHHAVMDGLHMGRYYQRFQEYLDTPVLLFD